jgi:hypothetical protein
MYRYYMTPETIDAAIAELNWLIAARAEAADLPAGDCTQHPADPDAAEARSLDLEWAMH